MRHQVTPETSDSAPPGKVLIVQDRWVCRRGGDSLSTINVCPYQVDVGAYGGGGFLDDMSKGGSIPYLACPML